MKPWPHTTVTFVSSGEGSGHVTRSVLVNGSPVTVALGGVEVSQPSPDEAQTVTLTLLPDEIHFVGPAEQVDDATNARYEREDAEARQDDPDTVTLLRDDAAQLLRFWEGDRTSDAPNTMASRVRAALGWGDEA